MDKLLNITFHVFLHKDDTVAIIISNSMEQIIELINLQFEVSNNLLNLSRDFIFLRARGVA